MNLSIVDRTAQRRVAVIWRGLTNSRLLRLRSFTLMYVVSGALTWVLLSHSGFANGLTSIHSASARLTLADPAPSSYDRFGWQLAETDSRILVGEPFWVNGAENVLVFDRDSGEFLRRIVPNDPQSSTYFGTALGADKTKLVVGSWYGNAAYLFDIETGQQLWKVKVPGSSLFGWSVAIQGDRVLVGDNADNFKGSQAGAAYILDTNSGNVLHTLRPADGRSYDSFGTDVAIDGGYALVESPGDNSVYQFDLATGALIRKLSTGGPLGGLYDWPGIAADKGRLIVGSTTIPAAYIFDLTTGAQIQELRVPGATRNDSFGFDVDISGDLAMVGARTTRVEGIYDVGVAYLFQVSSGELLAQFQLSQFAFNNVFGHSAHVDGNTVLLSAPGVDDYRGAVYIFEVPEPATVGLGLVAAVVFGAASHQMRSAGLRENPATSRQSTLTVRRH